MWRRLIGAIPQHTARSRAGQSCGRFRPAAERMIFADFHP
ncbi:hypothetical protein RBY4I_573 [Rhodobacterales bacterium Y4I]|nr:hypothetical protein RBY4I_573 [Rhodobacterales bacterium Y4I]